MIEDTSFLKKPVIDKLGKFATFYDQLGFSVMGFLAQGTQGIFGMDTYTFSSMQATLESIKAVLEKGRIGDGYALLRKYYDAVLINVYTNLYLEDHFSIDNFIVEKIENWRSGKEKLPTIQEMNTYISASTKMKPIYDLLYKDKRYSLIRKRCNNHTHYKFYLHIVLNDGRVHLEQREKYFEMILKDLDDIFILHLAYIFFLSDHYMMSFDYVDSLDMGLPPEEGSQYFVATFIQETFTEVIEKKRPDIAALIKGKTAMDLR